MPGDRPSLPGRSRLGRGVQRSLQAGPHLMLSSSPTPEPAESSEGDGKQPRQVHQHLQEQRYVHHSPPPLQDQQREVTWSGTETQQSSSTSGSIKARKKITPTKEEISFMQKQPESNLSSAWRGTWLETPGRGPATPQSSWTADCGSSPSWGRGKGTRSHSGAPVVGQTIGTLCPTASQDCRTTDFRGLGCKTTDTGQTETTDQWERAKAEDEGVIRRTTSETNPEEQPPNNYTIL